MTKEDLIDILENNEFDLYWNEKEGKEFRKYVVDLLYENESLLVKNDFLEEKQGWIPCSERLPETTDEVLVFTDYGSVLISWYSEEADYWGDDMEKDDVLAWMPLPTPYKGSEE